jgi:hypothetical protein
MNVKYRDSNMSIGFAITFTKKEMNWADCENKKGP